jgi:hypothetical protein
VPYSPPTRCTTPDCGRFLYNGENCPDHNWAGSTWQRLGLKTSDPRWQAVRSERLALYPYCQWIDDGDDLICAEDATEVDHLDHTDYADHSGEGRSWLNPEMTRSLCADHHRKRTAQQSAMSRRQYS